MKLKISKLSSDQISSLKETLSQLNDLQAKTERNRANLRKFEQNLQKIEGRITDLETKERDGDEAASITLSGCLRQKSLIQNSINSAQHHAEELEGPLSVAVSRAFHTIRNICADEFMGQLRGAYLKAVAGFYRDDARRLDVEQAANESHAGSQVRRWISRLASPGSAEQSGEAVATIEKLLAGDTVLEFIPAPAVAENPKGRKPALA